MGSLPKGHEFNWTHPTHATQLWTNRACHLSYWNKYVATSTCYSPWIWPLKSSRCHLSLCGNRFHRLSLCYLKHFLWPVLNFPIQHPWMVPVSCKRDKHIWFLHLSLTHHFSKQNSSKSHRIMFTSLIFCNIKLIMYYIQFVLNGPS